MEYYYNTDRGDKVVNLFHHQHQQTQETFVKFCWSKLRIRVLCFYNNDYEDNILNLLPIPIDDVVEG